MGVWDGECEVEGVRWEFGMEGVRWAVRWECL